MSLVSLPGREQGSHVTLGIETSPDDIFPEGILSRLPKGAIRKLRLLGFEEGLLPPETDRKFIRWNYLSEGAKKLADRVGNDTQAILTEPASLLPQLFLKCLDQLRVEDGSKNVRIQAGIPFPKSLNMLKKLFESMSIDPSTHLEAGFLLEKFERASRDGYIDFFTDTWTRNCLQWALSLAKADGAHFMPIDGFDDRAINVVNDVLGLTQHPTGADISSQNKDRFIELQTKLQKLTYPVPFSYFSGLMQNGYKVKDNTVNYADDFLTLLETTYSVISEMQKTYHDSDFWKRFSLHFVRMPQSNHAQIQPAEIIDSDDGKLSEMHIDLQYKKKYEDKSIYADLLRSVFESYFDAANRGISDNIELDRESDVEPMLDRFARQGWAIFGEMQNAEGKKGDAGTESAKKTEVVRFSAQQIVDALLAAPDDQEEYIIMEVGAWNANGIPEMLESLHVQVQGHDSRAELVAKLKKTKFVCIDIAQEGIESCKPVFDTLLPELAKKGLHIGGVDYQQCDLLNPVSVATLDRFKGNLVMVRGINTLDALESPLYVQRTHLDRKANIYCQRYITQLSKTALAELTKKTFTYFTNKGSDKNVLEANTFSVSDIEAALSGNQYGAELEYFMNYFVKKGFAREAALVLWKNVLNMMKKQHRYVAVVPDSPEFSRASELASLHPDLDASFETSDKASQTVQTLSQLLSPGGRCVFFNLTNSILTRNVQQHALSRAQTVLGVTQCIPVSSDSLILMSSKDGFVAETQPGELFGLSPTSSVIVVTRKPHTT